MNGPEHYRKAQDLAHDAGLILQQTAPHTAEAVNAGASALAALAQVHATLAHVAATVEAADQQIDTNYRRPLVQRPTKADDIDPEFPGSPWGRAFYGDLS